LIVLIHPPVAKPCEPPAGIAKISGTLRTLGILHCLLDVNIEGLLHMLGMPFPAKNETDSWTKRAFRHRETNLSRLREPGLYRNHDRYGRVVRDIERVLSISSAPWSITGLVNYEQRGLSPVRSEDLLHAAEHPELNSFYPFFRRRLEVLIRDKEPSVIGISLNYLSQAFCAFAMTGFIRREFPGIKIIVGGGLVTSWMRNPGWRNPFTGLADHFVAGPGEHQILSLLGVSAVGGKVPGPAYTDLPLHNYFSPGFVLPYSASTGCYWRKCAFCPENAEGNPYTATPSPQVLEEIQILSDKTRPALVHLLDNALSPELLEAITHARRGVPWYGFARISSRLTDPGFCLTLKEAGCVMLKLGIESGDQDVLDRMDKGITVEMAAAVLKNLKKAGIGTYVYLIFGTPAENEASARRTLEFTTKHGGYIDFLNLAIFNMPVCGDHMPWIEKNRFSEGDLSLYTDFIHPHGWDRKRVRLFLEHEFKKQPVIAKILRREPPVFTSNHAPFFLMERP
jgi:radical SAM superfamily enzyme YgiQ (UPF0313 family)